MNYEEMQEKKQKENNFPPQETSNKRYTQKSPKAKYAFVALATLVILVLVICLISSKNDPVIQSYPVDYVSPSIEPVKTPENIYIPSKSPSASSTYKVETKGTLGLTSSRFVTTFNLKAAEMGADISAYISNRLTDVVDINTTSDSVYMSVYVENDYITTVTVKGFGTGSAESGIEQMYAMVAAARAIDSTLTTSDASNFILEILNSTTRGGADYSKRKNGFKYTVSAEVGSTWLQISK